MGSKNSYRGEDLEDDLIHIWLMCDVDLVDDDGLYMPVVGGGCNQHPKMRLLEAYMIEHSEAVSAHTPDADVYINGAKACDISAVASDAIGDYNAGVLVNAETLLEKDEVVNVLVTKDSATTGRALVHMHFVVVE